MPYFGTQPSKGLVGTAGIDDNAVTGAKTKDALIGDYSDVTITSSDLIMYGDATDSNNTKRDTVQGILDLAPGGNSTLISHTANQAANAGASVASIEFTGLGNSNIASMEFDFLIHPEGTGSNLYLHAQVATSGPSWVTASEYISVDCGAVATNGTGTTAFNSLGNQGSQQGHMRIGESQNTHWLDSAAHRHMQGRIVYIPQYYTERADEGSALTYPMFFWHGVYWGDDTSPGCAVFSGGGTRHDATQIVGLKLFMSSGNFSSYRVTQRTNLNA